MRLRRSVHLLVLVAIQAGCGGDDESSSSVGGLAEEVSVNEAVHVLGESARQSLLAFDLDLASGRGELRFPADVPGLGALEEGRIVAAEPVGGIAPYGLLQRIESRREEGGEVVLVTRQATLEETFDEADIEEYLPLLPENLASAETRHDGITIQGLGSEAGTRRQGLGYDFSVDFDEVVVDVDGDESTTDDQLRLDGEIAFSAGVNARVKIGTTMLVVPTLELARFTAEMSESVDLTLEGNLRTGFTEEIEVARFDFGAMVVPVGPVPVVFSTDLALSVGASGQLEARLLATAEQGLEITVGAEYKRDRGWKNLSDFESHFDFPTPQIEAAGSARAFATPRLGVQIYGIAGPYAYSTAFVELEAEYDRDPFWNFVAGVDLGVGFRADLPVIGQVANWNEDFELFRHTLGDSPNAAPELEVLSPEDGVRISEGQLTSFEVRASDREQPTVSVSLVGGGELFDTEEADRGANTRLHAGELCMGTHEFEIVATDDEGATDTERRTLVVDNRVPEVSVRGDLLDEQPLYPGGILIAFADASDSSCDVTGNAALPELIEWYVDGQPAGSTDTLFYPIPATAQAGEEMVLEARYDDGREVGRSAQHAATIATRPPGANLPPVPIIRSPIDGIDVWVSANMPLEALAYDPEDGQLPEGELRWAFEQIGGGWIELPQGSTHFVLVDIYDWNSAHGRHRVRLTATDSSGQSAEQIITINGVVQG